MLGNSVVNSNWGSRPNEIQKIVQVWKHFGSRAFQPRYKIGNSLQLTTLLFFSSEVIPDFPTSLSCPPWPIFTSIAEWPFVLKERQVTCTYFFERCQGLKDFCTYSMTIFSFRLLAWDRSIAVAYFYIQCVGFVFYIRYFSKITGKILNNVFK